MGRYVLLSHTLFLVFLLTFSVLASAVYAQVGPDAPEISSTDFSDEEVYYNLSSGTFSWTLPEGITAVALTVSSDPEEEPEKAYRPPISEFTLEEDVLEEGVQYLHVQFKDDEEWGAVAHYAVRVDRTPPQDVNLELVTLPLHGGKPGLRVDARDALSGVDRFEVVVNGAVAMTFDEEGSGTLFPLLAEEAGLYVVEVGVYDRAGNVTVTEPATLMFADISSPLLGETELFLLAQSVIAILLVLYILMMNRTYRQKEQRLREEIDEVQEQTAKIFSVLRDDIYEQIQLLRGRKRISKKEAAALHNLDKTLKISKSVLEKEVEDVEKELR